MDRVGQPGAEAHSFILDHDYAWADGRTEVREFPAEYRDGRIWWDNELIKGWAAEVGLDEYNRTVMLYWQRQGDPQLYLYEMIQLSDDGLNRCRTWHWIRSGVLETRDPRSERSSTEAAAMFKRMPSKRRRRE